MKLINGNDVLHLLLSCSWSFSSSFLRHLVDDFCKRRRRWSPWLLAQPVMPRNTNNTSGKTQWCRPSGSQDKEETLKRVMRCLSTSNIFSNYKFRADLCSRVDCGCNNYGRRCDACVPGSTWKTMVALLSRSKVRQQSCTWVDTLSLKNNDDDNNNYDYNKLTAIDNLPDNTFLVSLDVTSLYTNIPHNVGIDAFRFFLQKRTNKHIPTETICDPIRIILTMNNFTFNSKHYLQKHGTAMGTRMAPSYANLFLGKFERDAP